MFFARALYSVVKRLPGAPNVRFTLLKHARLATLKVLADFFGFRKSGVCVDQQFL